GASISWKVTTLSGPKLESIDPKDAFVGDVIRIKGKNFSTVKEKNVVVIDKTQAKVVAATATELQAKIADNMQPSKQAQVSAKVPVMNGHAATPVIVKVLNRESKNKIQVQVGARMWTDDFGGKGAPSFTP